MKHFLRLTLASSIALCSSLARAEPTPSQRTVAEGLFDEGRALMMRDRYEEACPKLAESQRLDPGGGTLLNLALCHERLGLTATAWTEFREALAHARRDNRPDREQIALEHAERLEALLSRLKLDVLEANPELVLLVDGAELGPEARASAVPLDPGEHVVEARCPGKRPFKTSVAISASQTQTLQIPELEPLPVPPASPKVETPIRPEASKVSVDTASSGKRTAGYVVGGFGLVALAAGSYFGLRALSEDKKGDERCPSLGCTDPAGVRHSEAARENALIANVAFGVGAIALGTGTYLILSSNVGPAKNAQQGASDYQVAASLLSVW